MNIELTDLQVGLDNLEGTALLLNYLHPGIVDALYNVGAIERRAFSVYLNDLEAGKGNILFGGIDQAKYTGDLVTLPIGPNATGQYDRYRVDLSDMYFTDDAGETTTLTEQGARDPVILDTGVTLIAPPGEVVSQFVSGLGAVESDGILLVDCGISGSNATLGFQFGGDDGPYYNIDLSTLIYLLPEIRYPNGDQVCYLGMEPPTKDEVLGIELGGYSLVSACWSIDLAWLTQVSTGRSIPTKRLPRLRYRQLGDLFSTSEMG